MTTTHDRQTEFENLTAGHILAIAETEPERLFTGSEDALKAEYRALSKLWHPDTNKDVKATDVFARINVLYAKAKEKLACRHQ